LDNFKHRKALYIEALKKIKAAELKKFYEMYGVTAVQLNRQ
jgi:hypothetical protein